MHLNTVSFAPFIFSQTSKTDGFHRPFLPPPPPNPLISFFLPSFVCLSFGGGTEKAASSPSSASSSHIAHLLVLYTYIHMYCVSAEKHKKLFFLRSSNFETLVMKEKFRIISLSLSLLRTSDWLHMAIYMSSSEVRSLSRSNDIRLIRVLFFTLFRNKKGKK